MTRLLLRHAWHMIAADWGKTLRLTLVPWLIVVGLVVALDQMVAEPGQTAVIALVLVVTVAIYLWVLVGWHRYVLLGEGPRGLGPTWRGDPILGYLWAGLLLAVVTLIPLIPIGLGITAILSRNVMSLPLMDSVLALVMSYLTLRLGLILPAAAISSKMTIVTSWRKTAPVSGSIFGVSLALTGLSMLVEAAAGGMNSAVVFDVIFALCRALIGLLSVSVLTTLYGYLVEGRALAE